MNPWMILAWSVTTGLVLGLVALLTWILFSSQRIGPRRHRKSAGDAGSGFSVARYQVMARLLSPQEVQFLAAQRGFDWRAVARWKRDSLRIFRLYLREITRDFLALHTHARALVVESHSESPEFASMLVRQQTAFWRARLALEWRLLLFRWGIGSVAVAPLLEMIEAMRMDLSRLAPEQVQAL